MPARERRTRSVHVRSCVRQREGVCGMATQVVIYTVVHQPRRVKLPAQPIPEGASLADIERCIFDERMNERYFRKVANTCYYPATERFLQLVRAGMKLSI